MPQSKEAHAAYMRDRRAKTSEAVTRNADLEIAGVQVTAEVINVAAVRIHELEKEVAALQAEVKMLKRQLAMKAGSPVPTLEQWKAAGGPTVMHEGKEMIVPASLERPKVTPYSGSFGHSRPAPKPGKKG